MTSVVTMYGNVHTFVWLPWQQFKSRILISWGLFVTTTQRNTELLVHDRRGKIDFWRFVWIWSYIMQIDGTEYKIISNGTVIFWIHAENEPKLSHWKSYFSFFPVFSLHGNIEKENQSIEWWCNWTKTQHENALCMVVYPMWSRFDNCTLTECYKFAVMAHRSP